MKVLIVCSGKKENFIFEINQVFIHEQMKALASTHNVKFKVFLNLEKGLLGYLKNYLKLKKFLDKNNFDLIHAHYGYSGVIAVLQKGIPKIVTFHGSDINYVFNNLISSIAVLFSNKNIFVSEKLKTKSFLKKKNDVVIPCGIFIEDFKYIEKKEARIKMHLHQNKKYILFSSSFNKKVKNYPLAKAAVAMLKDDNVELIELNGYNREEVKNLLYACDVLLMTSFAEGSPQIIKEGMACGIPIVSTNVGEVKNIIKETEGCWIAKFDPIDLSNKLKKALLFNRRTNGREKILEFDNNIIARKIYNVYKEVLNL